MLQTQQWTKLIWECVVLVFNLAYLTAPTQTLTPDTLLSMKFDNFRNTKYLYVLYNYIQFQTNQVSGLKHNSTHTTI